MSRKLGYKQVTGTVYVKQRTGWYERFVLQAPSNNTVFFINYGVVIPKLWPPFERKSELKDEDYILSNRLHDDNEKGFRKLTKSDILESAAIALDRYEEQAVPWFSQFRNILDITEYYFNSTQLSQKKIGTHDSHLMLAAADYGLLLKKTGKYGQSLIWLREAERLMSLPVYFTRNGRTVHKWEKHARLCKAEESEIEQLEHIRHVIVEMESTLKKIK